MTNTNDKPVLVIMAAGLGSRFNGLKQIHPVDDAGHILMDYAVYDALEVGFSEIVFIIRKSFEQEFKDIIGDRISKKCPVTYVFQELDDFPGKETGIINLPEDRKKPWGTTHALWSARKVLKGRKFLTINADDFYGRGAYKAAYEFFENECEDNVHGCICYDLIKTLSATGTVSRGICQVDGDNKLVRIDERKKIKLEEEAGVKKGYYTLDGGETYTKIPSGAVASMNLWAFGRGFIDDIEVFFEKRFEEGVNNSPDTFEETISDAVQDILSRNAGQVICIPTDEQWFGMTYIEELDMVKERLRELREEGIYVESKW